MQRPKFKRFFLAPIRGYQYISRMLPGSCRYYPTCSEYAAQQFEFERPDRAFAASALRILRCNQLFPGGIDYPKVRWNPPASVRMANPIRIAHTLHPLPNPPHSDFAIKYWIVPIKGKTYLIVKAFG